MLNNALLENNCSEQASRMSAMESSTKNAKEMLEKLTLSYNRHVATLKPCLQLLLWRMSCCVACVAITYRMSAVATCSHHLADCKSWDFQHVS